jgi:alpha-glucosidase
MRPLAMAFPHDRRTYSLDDQFILGDALLAAPVCQPGQTPRPVLLPGGPWHDFWTGQPRSAEITAAPLERMPLFVRAGSVVPTGTVMQHTNECPPQALRLRIYPGNGTSWLYEDDGDSLAYQAGDFCRTRFVCEQERDRQTIRREAEGPYEPGYGQFEITVYGRTAAPRQVRVDGQAVHADHHAGTKTLRIMTEPWSSLVVE